MVSPHLLDVNAARQHIGRDENLLVAFSEAIENSQSLVDSEISAQHANALASDLLRHFAGEPSGCFASLNERDEVSRESQAARAELT